MSLRRWTARGRQQKVLGILKDVETHNCRSGCLERV